MVLESAGRYNEVGKGSDLGLLLCAVLGVCFLLLAKILPPRKPSTYTLAYKKSQHFFFSKLLDQQVSREISLFSPELFT